MTHVIYTHKNGTKYVYESTSYYDKEKKQARPKRKLIGKIDPETGEIVPTQPRGRKTKSVGNPLGAIQSVKSYGATYLVKELANKMGILSDLEEHFPYCYHELLTLIQYLILEPDNTINEFEYWQTKVETTLMNPLSSTHVSELITAMSEEDRDNFFKTRYNRFAEEECWVFNTTTLSTYSTSDEAQSGYNYEDDDLKQVNLGIVFSEASRVPVMYRILPTNIIDSKTIETLLSLLDYFSPKKKKIVLGSEFYKERNIQMLCKEGIDFIIGGKRGIEEIDGVIERILIDITEIDHYSSTEKLYIHSEKISGLRALEMCGVPLTIHVYLDKFLQYQQETKLMNDLDELLTLLNHEEEYRNGFESSHHPLMKYVKLNKDNNKYLLNAEIIKKRIAMMGAFVLLSNTNKSAEECLRLFQDRDWVEKKFLTWTNGLELRRLSPSGDDVQDGKLFVQFLSVIVESYLREQMRNVQLDEHYTIEELLEALKNVYTYSDGSGNRLVAEISDEQAKIYERFGVLKPFLSMN
ncbi:transposase [Aerococcaceae bacterium zg-BR9]|uniref:IS1634 family transposase n=1 Tax=Aerococcaceae bacterium zg-1292 TaxID=2774330 RepID=UPI0040642D1A|nr:transposase [Aerococcaceae bacterium zg-BR9]